MEFTYAHKDTSAAQTPTAQFNSIKFPEAIEEIRLAACAREIPVSDIETLTFISTLISATQPQNILEIGTAVGLSAAVMLDTCKSAHITTIEKDENFFAEAKQNFLNLGISSKITPIFGDAIEVLPKLEGEFDFIFLDSAKVQYVKYLPQLKRLLKQGGTLLADDVLLFGYVSGECETPKKRRMLVQHLKEYISAVKDDPQLITTVINLGNGLAMSVKW